MAQHRTDEVLAILDERPATVFYWRAATPRMNAAASALHRPCCTVSKGETP